MSKIQIEKRLEVFTTIEIDVDDFIDEVNEMEMIDRWNTVAKILNQVELEIDQLDVNQKIIVQNYLAKKSQLFTNQSEK